MLPAPRPLSAGTASTPPATAFKRFARSIAWWRSAATSIARAAIGGPKRPVGYTTYMDLLHDPRFRLPSEIELQTIGADQYPLWAGPAGWQTACQQQVRAGCDLHLEALPGPRHVYQRRQYCGDVSGHPPDPGRLEGARFHLRRLADHDPNGGGRGYRSAEDDDARGRRGRYQPERRLRRLHPSSVDTDRRSALRSSRSPPGYWTACGREAQ